MFLVQTNFPGVGLYKHVATIAEDAGIALYLWFIFVFVQFTFRNILNQNGLMESA